MSKLLAAVGLFFGFGIMLLFGISLLGGMVDDLAGTVPIDYEDAFNTTVSAIDTGLTISSYLPWLLMLVILICGIMSVYIVKKATS
jgi:uncharacterized BrkB/YihY/UPF0761 family membrane protein